MNRSDFVKKLPLLLTGLLFIPNITSNTRRVEHYNDGWKGIDFKNVKKDMYIQMFESDNKPVIMGWKNGNPMYGARAISDAYIGKSGVLTFESKIL